MLLYGLFFVGLAQQTEIIYDDMTFLISNESSTATFVDCSKTIVQVPSQITYNKATYTVDTIAARTMPSTIQITLPNTIKGVNMVKCSAISIIFIDDGIENIGDEWFSNIRSTFNITLPNSVKTIGNRVFQNSNVEYVMYGSQLTKIQTDAFNSSSIKQLIPQSESNIQEIEQSAFNDCRKLVKIDNIIQKLTVINDLTFNNCVSLNGSLKLPEQLTSIGKQSFMYTKFSEITYGPNLNKIDDKSFSFSSLVEIKPYGDNNIQEIGSNVFEECRKLTNAFSLLQKVTKISGGIFKNCVVLAGDLELPETVETIESEAFYKTAITKVTFGNNLTSIGSYSFCFTKISDFLPRNESKLAQIGDAAFSRCYSLSKIPDVIFNLPKWSPHLFAYCKNLTSDILYPESLTELGDFCFQGTNILSFKPKGVNNLQTIGAGVFMDCSKLQNSFEIFEKLTEIPSQIFMNCSKINGTLTLHENITKLGNSSFSKTSLDTVKFNEKLTEVGSSCFAYSTIKEFSPINNKNSIQTIGEKAFYQCQKLSDISFIANLETIPERMFSGANNLPSELEIPDKITKIGGFAFLSCKSIKKVTFGQQLTSLSDGVFQGSSIETFTPRNTNNLVEIGKQCFSYSKISDISFLTNIKNISDMAFYYCLNLNISVTLSDTVEMIGEKSFSNSKITSIVFGKNLNTIGDECFASSAIQSVSFKSTNNLQNFGISIFKDCKNLTNGFEIFEKSDIIPDFTFYYCISLNDVTLPNTITKIGVSSFEKTKFKTFTYGEKLQNIDTNAFRYSELSEIKCSSANNVSEIGQGAFSFCLNLENINDLLENVLVINPLTFYNCSKLSTDLILHCKSIGYSAFQSTSIQSVKFDSSLENISDFSFANSALTVFSNNDVESNIKYIKNSAFLGCQKLTISLDDIKNVLELGRFAFKGCQKLTIPKLPENLKSIGDEAFSFTNMETLKELNLQKIEKIGRQVFKNCNIKDISIETDQRSIDFNNLFANCKDMKSKVNLAYDNNLTVNKNIFNMFKKAELVISPKSNDDKTVVTFEENAAAQSSVQKVIVTANTVNIMSGAFNNTLQINSFTVDCQSLLVSKSSFGSSSIQKFEMKKEATEIKLKNSCFKSSKINAFDFKGKIAELGDYSFYNCKEMKGDLVIDGPLTKIGQSCFEDCSSLDGKLDLKTDSLVEIGCFCFKNCNFNCQLKLPMSVEKIGISVFENLKLLNGEVVIPVKITNISRGMFSGCSKITNFVLPQNLKSIENYAFTNCESWKSSINLSKSLVYLGDFAFENCSQLNGILRIPANVSFVGYHCFFNCKGFKRVYLDTFHVSVGKKAFGGMSFDCISNLPVNCSKKYSKDSVCYDTNSKSHFTQYTTYCEDCDQFDRAQKISKAYPLFICVIVVIMIGTLFVLYNLSGRRRKDKQRIRDITRNAVQSNEVDSEQIPIAIQKELVHHPPLFIGRKTTWIIICRAIEAANPNIGYRGKIADKALQGVKFTSFCTRLKLNLCMCLVKDEALYEKSGLLESPLLSESSAKSMI